MAGRSARRTALSSHVGGIMGWSNWASFGSAYDGEESGDSYLRVLLG